MKERLIILMLVFSIHGVLAQAVKTSVAPEEEKASAPAQTRVAAEQLEEQYFELRNKSVSTSSKDIVESEQKQLNAVVDEMESKVAGTYEYHYVKFINSKNSPSQRHHLDQAYELSTNKSTLYDEYIGLYEVMGSSGNKKSFCIKLKQSGIIKKGVFNYNYNVLMSLERNAILFTNGYDDTYPLWVLQEVDGVRKDVTILNIDLLEDQEYRSRMFKQLGLRYNSAHDYNKTKYITRLAQQNSDRPIYFGLTFSKGVLKGLKGGLYVTGVAMRYTPGSYNNLTLLNTNWETRFKKPDPHKAKSSKEKKLQMNYILPLVNLWKFYESNGSKKKALEVKSLALEIAKNNNKEDQVKKHFKKLE